MSETPLKYGEVLKACGRVPTIDVAELAAHLADDPSMENRVLRKIAEDAEAELAAVTAERDEALAAMASDGADAVSDNQILRSENARLRGLLGEAEMALQEILADHDERMQLYPDKNSQENRVRVMKIGKNVLAKLAEGGRR